MINKNSKNIFVEILLIFKIKISQIAKKIYISYLFLNFDNVSKL